MALHVSRLHAGPAGALIFHYRDGGSGNGQELYNVYDPPTRRWRRFLDKPIISGLGPWRAYMCGPTLGPDGWYHLLWVWRDTPDAATNHFGFDSSTRVVLTDHKHDAAGNTQAYAARFADGAWRIRAVSGWQGQHLFRGGGSGPAVFGTSLSLGTVERYGTNKLALPFQHWNAGSGVLVFDEATLAPLGTEAALPENGDLVLYTGSECMENRDDDPPCPHQPEMRAPAARRHQSRRVDPHAGDWGRGHAPDEAGRLQRHVGRVVSVVGADHGSYQVLVVCSRRAGQRPHRPCQRCRSEAGLLSGPNPVPLLPCRRQSARDHRPVWTGAATSRTTRPSGSRR